jgi:hypothetical protein
MGRQLRLRLARIGTCTQAIAGSRGQQVVRPRDGGSVPNGTSVLKLSVLKALGNGNNSVDWETFSTPPITLAAPVASKRREAPRSRGLSHVVL